MKKKQTLKLFTTVIVLFFVFTSVHVFADDPITKEFDVKPFTKIYLKGPYKVTLRQGSECKLRIEASENQMDRIDVDSNNGTLNIDWDGKDFKKTKNIELTIRFEALEKIEILGAVDLESIGELKVENLKIEFEGAGDLDLELDADKIISEINGVGSFDLSGKTVYHKVEFSGVGSYNARELFSDYTLVESNGVGNVKVYAAKEFRGNANGVGSVDYWGEPEEVDINATGVGSINGH